MKQPTPMSAVLRFSRTAFFLLLVTCSFPLVGASLAAPNPLHSLEDFTYPYGSIFSPLLKALAEHGGSRWNPELKRKMKPEHKYMNYLTQVYKTSSRVQRSLDADQIYNTVRLIKPRDECLAESNKGDFMQDLSYSLDQVRGKEQLLKSALLYNFDRAAPVNSVCYLSLGEPENANQCPLCPEVRHSVNFTVGTDSTSRRNWVEVDVTFFLRPLLKFQKKNLRLLINVTCPGEQRAIDEGRKALLKYTLRSPLLLLYLHDTSRIAHPQLPADAKAGRRPDTVATAYNEQMVIKQEQSVGRKRRWKRESRKSKQGDKGLDIQLPELLPSSEFQTSDCALYDFRVRFSQLKLDHWIVFPPKYNPRYCRGICPRTIGFFYGSPVHTMVQNIIYEKLDSSVPRPSCIPSHYSPLSVMIFEEDGSYVYKEFEDMVATRCTCR